jgi:flagellar export protein FliJ
MRRFRFPLEAVLTVRKRQENQALERYGAAVRGHREAAAAVSSAERDLLEAWGGFRVEMEGGCDGARLACQRAQCQALDLRGRKARERLRQAEQEMRASHEGLIEARRQREVVEKLEERAHREHARERQREEARFLDELALQRCRVGGVENAYEGGTL